MSDSSALPTSCPQCGTALPAEVTEGLCPKCLMAQAMQLPPAKDSGGDDAATIQVSRPRPSLAGNDAIDLPLPEELAALLPEGAYHVEDFIGKGGMGAVYKGTQVRLKRPVAIKIMRRDQGMDHDFEARFEREAQAMAKLNHPNIVSVIDYGEAGPEYLYIVMELVDGADLMEVIRSGRMTQEIALSLLPQICDALQFAHDHGIVHRDIKPSNIMLTRDGQIKMADFGLAKRYDAESNFRTQTGTGMGTPDYAAPEQFDLSAQIDHRADIYALGVMIYQMITGALPRGVWKPPSERAEISPKWDNIVSHAMQTDPKDRYQSANEMKTDFRRIPLAQGSAGVDARPSDKGGEAGKSGGADKSVRASVKSRAALLIGALVILLAGAYFVFTPKTEPQATITTSSSSPSSATKDVPFVNTLGMKFVPVPITGGPTDGKPMLFSVWDTRVQDYDVFATETKVKWMMADFEQGPAHPAVMVNWEEAQAFCQWLTKREQAAGQLPAGWKYRLPSDHEWSCAVGIGDQEDATKSPIEKNAAITDQFPWGTSFPPPWKAGNYASEELRPALAEGKFPYVKDVIFGYRDGYPNTSPVGSYPGNQFGLCDMGGNVGQWCEDWRDQDHVARVVRGSSFAYDARPQLLSSTRNGRPPTMRLSGCGFRCVLAPGA